MFSHFYATASRDKGTG
ncbi:hypothetical protein YPPY98_2539, partial [Yersinia pestis PY-98]